MKKSLNNHLTATLALTLIFSVVLNSMHAADAAAYSSGKLSADHASVKKVASDDPNALKIIGELHNHVDKHTLKSITKTFSESNVSADPRLKRHLKNQQENELDQLMDWLKRMAHSALLFIA